MPGPEALDVDTILNATEGVLRRHGPDKATVVDVARVLGVSHGSIYRHFRSKADLREAVIRRWLEASRPAPADVSGDAAQRLRSWLTALIHGKWAQAREDPELFATLQLLSSSSSRVGIEYVAGMLRQIEDFVDEGVGEGSLRTVDPARTAQAVLDALTRFVHPALASGWNAPGIADDLEDVLDLLMSGLAKEER